MRQLQTKPYMYCFSKMQIMTSKTKNSSVKIHLIIICSNRTPNLFNRRGLYALKKTRKRRGFVTKKNITHNCSVDINTTSIKVIMIPVAKLIQFLGCMIVMLYVVENTPSIRRHLHHHLLNNIGIAIYWLSE